MSTPATLDLETFIAPLPGDAPAGPDLRLDPSPQSDYQKVKDARAQARTCERQAQQLGPDYQGPPPEWKPVIVLASKILSTQAKDLEVCAWLVEALARDQTHAFASLRDGFSIARQLLEKYWDQLHPLKETEGEADGWEHRIAAFTALNGDERDGLLIAPIAVIPLAQSDTILGEAAYRNIQRATDPAKREELEQQFVAAAAAASPEFVSTLRSDLQECIQEYQKLTDAFSAKLGSNSPPASNIRRVLESCLEAVKHFYPSQESPPEAAGDAPAATATSADGRTAGPALPTGALNREGAFKALQDIANFFRRTEPHSPVSYGLEQIVRWGRQPLPELWAELIPDEGSRSAVFKLVGIQPKPDSQT